MVQERLGRVFLALGLLGLALSVTAAIAPRIADAVLHESQPGVGLLAAMGVIVIVATGLFIEYARRVMSLSTAWLVAALFYNFVILFIKFILSPNSLYSYVFRFSNISPSMAALGSGALPFIAVSTFILYALGALVIFWLSRMWLRTRVRHLTGGWRPPGLPSWAFGVILGLVLVPSLIASAIFLLIGGGDYYSALATAAPGLVWLLLLAAAVGAGVTFYISANASIRVRDLSLLTAVFWVAISLVFVYHVVWVIYAGALVTIYPLKAIRETVSTGYK